MSAASSTSALPAKPLPRNPWIVNWWQDLLWFVAPPLFLVPIFAILGRNVPLEQLALFVASFGAVGHHLPGMLRAYGDAELFSRYKTRFILAPILLVTVSVSYAFYRPHALAVIVLLWGGWHAQAQVYGFLRIYDAKSGSSDARTAALDRLLCLSWFAGGMVMSDGRLADLLTTYYLAGGSSISATAIEWMRNGFLVVMAVAATLFLGHTAWKWAGGHRPSPIKFCVLVLSIAFWWHCMVGLENVILGVALFEVFHDVQYLAIVWVFNRRRADSGASAGGLTRFLFRPQGRFVVLYLILVFGYGACSLLTRIMGESAVRTVLTGVFAASGLLHFYYDGFIWRIREQGTSQTLGLQHRSLAAMVRRPRQWVHAAAWMLFAAPLLLLSLNRESDASYQRVVDSLPESAEAHLGLAAQLKKTGQLEEAESQVRQALALRAPSSKALSMLGDILLSQGEISEAIAPLREAVSMDPLNAGAHFNLGTALIRTRQIDGAIAEYDAAMRLEPDYAADAYNNLGTALKQAGAIEEAESTFRQAIDADPNHVNALCNLAQLAASAGKTEEAQQWYRQALKTEPNSAPALSGMAQLLVFSGQNEQGELLAKRLAEYWPSHPAAYSIMGFVRLKEGDPEAAERAFQQSLQLDPENSLAQFGLRTMQSASQDSGQQLRSLEQPGEKNTFPLLEVEQSQ